jgi:hypothetical protein
MYASIGSTNKATQKLAQEFLSVNVNMLTAFSLFNIRKYRLSKRYKNIQAGCSLKAAPRWGYKM